MGCNTCDALPSPLVDSTKPKYRNNEKIDDPGHTPNSQHFKGGRGACWSSGMGLGRVSSNALNQTNLHKSNKQVG
jgi:hypothetical protein